MHPYPQVIENLLRNKMNIRKKNIESSPNSTCALVRSWLFCRPHLPCLIDLHTWRYYGGLDEEQSTLRVETQFGMPRGAKMNLALNQLK